MQKNFCALISGGKDSIYTIYKLKQQGYTPVVLLYINSTTDEIDSYMYQSIGKELISCYSECLQLPLVKHNSKMEHKNIDLEYKETADDEVESLYEALRNLKTLYNFEFVSSGAIHSSYQKNRVENVCNRLSLTSLTPLWHMDQSELLKEMVKSGIDALICKVACPGLTSNMIGMSIKDLQNYIENNKDNKYLSNMNVCGEGGEYETIVLDVPHFYKK